MHRESMGTEKKISLALYQAALLIEMASLRE
jgi:hypothetical protein